MPTINVRAEGQGSLINFVQFEHWANVKYSNVILKIQRFRIILNLMDALFKICVEDLRSIYRNNNLDVWELFGPGLDQPG